MGFPLVSMVREELLHLHRRRLVFWFHSFFFFFLTHRWFINSHFCSSIIILLPDGKVFSVEPLDSYSTQEWIYFILQFHLSISYIYIYTENYDLHYSCVLMLLNLWKTGSCMDCAGHILFDKVSSWLSPCRRSLFDFEHCKHHWLYQMS